MTDPDIVDIVTLLRSPDRFEPHTCNAAADEIERLRKEITYLTVLRASAVETVGKMSDHLAEAKARNVRLLSQLQEYEAREQ